MPPHFWSQKLLGFWCNLLVCASELRGRCKKTIENPSNLAFSLFHCNFISIHAISCHDLYQSITLAHKDPAIWYEFPDPQKDTWQTLWRYRTSLLWRHRATLEILHVQLPSKHVSWGMMRGSKRSPNSPHTKGIAKSRGFFESANMEWRHQVLDSVDLDFWFSMVAFLLLSASF